MTEIFRAVERPRSAASGVEQHLKELMHAGRLTAGDRLPPERQLAERLGVNRSTLRSALQSLTEQGILAGRQGAGWVIQPSGEIVAANLATYLSLEDVTFDQLFEARRAVEPPIAASAARHRTDEQITALRACITAMQSTTDSESYLQADSDFHALLAVASHNPVFSVLITPTLTLLQDVRRRLAAEQSVISVSHQEHQQILDAVENQDTEAAHDAMLGHIDRFVDSSNTIMRDDPAR
ncbi:FadR/GntR family transcriptional regulator [Actinomadura citrea]|uniref:FadR/GntR family transcriptional regulator n=1 Tax=Actinomadura citrea TaxID=46158 RepID=UPI003CE4B4CC